MNTHKTDEKKEKEREKENKQTKQKKMTPLHSIDDIRTPSIDGFADRFTVTFFFCQHHHQQPCQTC